MEDRYDISVDIGEGKDYTSQVFLHGKEVKWDDPIDTLFIKPAMQEEWPGSGQELSHNTRLERD